MADDAPTESRYVLVARFDQPAAARQAMLALEGEGIDAEHIRLHEAPAVPTQEATRGAELAATGDVARRYAGGGLVGAAVGAVVVTAIVLMLGVAPLGLAILGGAVAGGISGFLLGGFWGAAAKLPVNEQSFDTYAMDPQASGSAVTVEVSVDGPTRADEAAEVLRHHRASHVDRRDG